LLLPLESGHGPTIRRVGPITSLRARVKPGVLELVWLAGPEELQSSRWYVLLLSCDGLPTFSTNHFVPGYPEAREPVGETATGATKQQAGKRTAEKTSSKLLLPTHYDVRCLFDFLHTLVYQPHLADFVRVLDHAPFRDCRLDDYTDERVGYLQLLTSWLEIALLRSSGLVRGT
jgi:hypothetical protein